MMFYDIYAGSFSHLPSGPHFFYSPLFAVIRRYSPLFAVSKMLPVSPPWVKNCKKSVENDIQKIKKMIKTAVAFIMMKRKLKFLQLIEETEKIRKDLKKLPKKSKKILRFLNAQKLSVLQGLPLILIYINT